MRTQLRSNRFDSTSASARVAVLAGLALFCMRASLPAAAQEPGDQGSQALQIPSATAAFHPLEMSSVATNRFVAAHGRQSVVMGYPQQGLEVWSYPLQIIAGYQIGFRPEGAASETDGRLLLRRVIESPSTITRVYVGPYYVVREKLFVPLDQPAAILSYEVDSARPVDICIHFQPVLDLMWPGALGGQSTQWHAEIPGYLLSEPAHNLSAVIGSPEIEAHDATVNSTLHAEPNLSFDLRPHRTVGGSPGEPFTATVFISGLAPAGPDAAVVMRSLAAQAQKMEVQAITHYDALQQSALRVETPDAGLNAALAWSEIALDQAWVCNPQLGCGIVAGYGPSRPGRRPQYAWFFAGDGLVATNALVSAGEYTRAREELEFIAKYQDKKTGMVWHELTQSAAYLDWQSYIYMFVHVDISFDYLNTVARYVAVSGDKRFAETMWLSIAAAYSYCHSLVGADGIPHIPTGKEGADEQHRPADDLGVSSSWVTASRNFSALAMATGHAELAQQASAANEAARRAVAQHYWDSASDFWADGHTPSGAPILPRSSGPGEAILENIFSPQQNEDLLDQIASAKFQTDWGTRFLAMDSAIYDPGSYGAGSVSALHSANTAATYWLEHRPQTAWSIYSGLLPWNTLDALGHIHELLAGDYYREQAESVPEQTWSSAGLLDSAVRGLLGLDVDGAANRVTFRPHLPPQWDKVSVEHIHLPHSTLKFTMTQSIAGVELEIVNDGAPVAVDFGPEIPLGAKLSGAQFAGRPVQAKTEQFAQDEHARVAMEVPPGVSRCLLQFTGGIAFLFPASAPRVGDASTGIKLIRLRTDDKNLSIDADVNPAGETHFRIRTLWKLTAGKGAEIKPLPDHEFDIGIVPPTSTAKAGEYAPAHLEIHFTGP